MPKVSEYTKNINPKVLDNVYERLFKTIAMLRNEQETKLFLDDLLTNTEKVMLAKRLIIAIMLRKNYSYAEIGNILKVSDATISNISEKLHKSRTGFEFILDRIEDEESVEEFFRMIKQHLPQIKIPPRGKGRWKFLNSL